MKLFRYTLRTYWQSIHSIRFTWFIAVMSVMLMQLHQPLLRYSKQMHYPVGPWIFLFLMTCFPCIIDFS
jgi:hypothetical protein